VGHLRSHATRLHTAVRESRGRADSQDPRRPRSCGPMVRDSRHEYLVSLPSPVGQHFSTAFTSILGHQQVTDAYLLALAGQQRATFLTFDARLQSLARQDAKVEILAA
jgi:predicted nucleic acid-binding protein